MSKLLGPVLQNRRPAGAREQMYLCKSEQDSLTCRICIIKMSMRWLARERDGRAMLHVQTTRTHKRHLMHSKRETGHGAQLLLTLFSRRHDAIMRASELTLD